MGKSNYESYDHFVKSNTGAIGTILEVGSTLYSRPLSVATKFTIDENFRSFFIHNFIDWDFFYNGQCSKEAKLQYKDVVVTKMLEVMGKPELFVSFWSKYIIPCEQYKVIEVKYTANKEAIKHSSSNFMKEIKDLISPELKTAYSQYMKEHAPSRNFEF